MSEANTNADEQQTFVNADRLQQDLNQQVAEENRYNRIKEDLLRDGFEIVDDDEVVEYGVARVPLTGYRFPTNRPSIVELIFDAEQQKYVIATSPEATRAMSSVTVDCDDRNK